MFVPEALRLRMPTYVNALGGIRAVCNGEVLVNGENRWVVMAIYMTM